MQIEFGFLDFRDKILMTHLQKNVTDSPCKRLVGLKFELTNQDSKGGKNWTVLSVYVTRKGTEVGQFFSLETPLNIVQNMIHSLSSKFGAKMCPCVR